MSGAEDPKRLLLAGVEALNLVMQPHGFNFQLETQGTGSGGHFASGSYRKGDRRLELHFRYALGLVIYHIGLDSLDHETYMRLLGVYGQNQYPDFPVGPLDSFQHLASDIQTYCSDFVFGDGQVFHLLAAAFGKDSRMFKGIP